jgi:hypothetical protein
VKEREREREIERERELDAGPVDPFSLISLNGVWFGKMLYCLQLAKTHLARCRALRKTRTRFLNILSVDGVLLFSYSSSTLLFDRTITAAAEAAATESEVK